LFSKNYIGGYQTEPFVIKVLSGRFLWLILVLASLWAVAEQVVSIWMPARCCLQRILALGDVSAFSRSGTPCCGVI